MAKTKEKILDSALKLFNQNGIVNVRLQHIADDAIVSVGNLAYHFPTKEIIVKNIYEELTSKQNILLAEFRIVPLFSSIDRLLVSTFQLQENYIFFYLDTLEILRAYPHIGEQHKKHIKNQIKQLRIMVQFNVSRGALINEQQENAHERLASQIWMTMDFWLTQQAIKSEDLPSVQNYKSAIWNLLMPYFTDMGLREYHQMLQDPYDFYF